MTSVPPPNLYALFQARFPRENGALFLDIDDPAGHVPYDAIDTETGRLQAWLAELGVAKGDRVLVQVEKSPLAILLYLACLRRGAIYVPLNTAYTTEEVAYFLDDAAPRVLVCDPAREAALAPVAARAGVTHVRTLGADGDGSVGAYRQCAPDSAIAACATDDTAAILYTSGTTGRSKGAMLSHANLAANALTLHHVWRWVPGDVLLHALPIFHAHGLFVALHCALLNGSRVRLVSGFDAARVVALLRDATVFMGVPTHYTRLLAEPTLDDAACGGMRLFLSGSAPLLASTHRAFTARTGHQILERYGMTEAGMITSNPYDGPRIPGCVGPGLPGVDTRVVDDQGRECRRGDAGTLEIRGPNVFTGYWRMPERTAEEFRSDGFFITGDLATMADDGRVTLVGRAKDLIISGGFNVYPKEIETALDALPGVYESAVIGLPHPDFGEGVTAVVVPEAGAHLVEAALIAALSDTLARFKQPKRVFVVAELPRNAMGKVQKAALRTQLADTYGGA